jgi:hypothetical protein
VSCFDCRQAPIEGKRHQKTFMLDVEAKVARISDAESTVNVYEAIKLRLEHLPLAASAGPAAPPTS